MALLGGVGFAGTGNASFRNNRNLLKNRRRPFNKDKIPDKATYYHRAFKDKNVSRKKLMNLLQRIQEDKRKETFRLILILISAAVISLILLLLVWHYLFQF